jgi:DNA invertase Pin-like site-specific DNA recombinase
MTKTADTPKLNVGIYARVSPDKQDNGNQLEQLREFAARQGWAIPVEYVDTVTGSGRKTRPQFERMLLAASQRQFDLLLFWALDRLSRGHREDAWLPRAIPRVERRMAAAILSRS